LGGIRHYRDDAEFYSTRHFDSVTDSVQQFAGDDLVAEPGTKYQYSTFGFVLAGAAIEAASGTAFPEYLRRNIFEPAGMTNTRTDDVYEIIPNRARGYRRTADGKVVNASFMDSSNKVPGGGLISTAEDLVRFALAVAEHRLLKQSSVELMFTPQTTPDGHSTGYGLGWGLPKTGKHLAAVHSGGQAGVSTYLWSLPGEKLAAAMMFNLQGVSMEELIRAVMSILTGTDYNRGLVPLPDGSGSVRQP
jgi:CubicO group peptidase (beta-lactamase class C family)